MSQDKYFDLEDLSRVDRTTGLLKGAKNMSQDKDFDREEEEEDLGLYYEEEHPGLFPLLCLAYLVVAIVVGSLWMVSFGPYSNEDPRPVMVGMFWPFFLPIYILDRSVKKLYVYLQQTEKQPPTPLIDVEYEKK